MKSTLRHNLCIGRKPLGNPNPQASNLALGVVLLIVLFLQAGFNVWQDFSTSRVMSSIKGMLPSDVLVLRDGNKVKLPAADLVNGDLIYLSLGEKVPADLRLIQVSGDLRFDRSILTWEVRLSTVFPYSPQLTSCHVIAERTYCWACRHDGQELLGGIQQSSYSLRRGF